MRRFNSQPIFILSWILPWSGALLFNRAAARMKVYLHHSDFFIICQILSPIQNHRFDNMPQEILFFSVLN